MITAPSEWDVMYLTNIRGQEAPEYFSDANLRTQQQQKIRQIIETCIMLWRYTFGIKENAN